MTESDSEPADIARPGTPTKPFVSYAQNFEDVMLYRALRGVEQGYYVDVGACEPEHESVTCAFYRRGWRGINLEPAPGAFKRLSASRHGDINLNIAAGDRDGTTSFFLIGGGNGLSTAVPGQAERLREQGWDSIETQTPVRTLASIFKEYVNGPIHFLKIDAEGSERAVLAGADLHQFRPWIILVEATAPNSQMSTHHDWEDLLLEAGYRFVWFDGLNRFYLSDERIELEAAFQVQPNVFDGFVRHTEYEANAQLTETRNRLVEATRREQQANDEAARLVEERDEWERELLEVNRAKLVEATRREQQANAEAARLVEERDAWAQELFEANRHSAQTTQMRQTLQDENRRLAGEVERLHGHIAAIYASTSWKFALPVRVVGKLWRRR